MQAADFREMYMAKIKELTAPGGAMEIGAAPPEVGHGAGLRAFVKGPMTIRALCEHTLRTSAERPAVLYAGEDPPRSQTWGELLGDARALSHALVAKGLRKGDRVGVLMANCPEWMAAFLAAAACGGVATALNSMAAGQEIAAAARQAQVRWIFADERRAARLGPETAAALAAEGVTFVVVGTAPQGATPYAELLAAGQHCAAGGEFALAGGSAVLPSDDGVVFFTSGTEGRAKCVLHTNHAVMQSVHSYKLPGAAFAAMSPAPRPPPTRFLAPPLFHIAGCVTNFLMPLSDGAKIVILPKWDAARAMQLIEQERVSLFSGPPAMITDMLDHPDFAMRDLSSLVNVGFGGAATPPAVIRRTAQAIPSAQPGTGWGGTETNGQGTAIVGAEWLANPACTGRPLAIVDVKVVDPDTGRELPSGEEGELCIRSPANMRCYLGDEAGTAAATLPGGWYRSGDLGKFTEGQVFVTGRCKDVINRGGEKISAQEVECALLDHPAVLEAAVFGVPAERLGEAVAARISLREGATATTAAQLRQHLLGRLAPYKVPEEQHFIISGEPLPRTATGKVLKAEVRRAAAAALAP
eukprot:TRINITY_DN9755_c0_g1_i1.p1 TRINITY_DN9755_c0_g1~~TRINITY_DN9755_c0_g1_i1.p1  ORF type:complete len:583 (+),score=168.68 TRINITY_DN9755_c0_g1_i1:87-1835(+)